jgi:hypothetical protein
LNYKDMEVGKCYYGFNYGVHHYCQVKEKAEFTCSGMRIYYTEDREPEIKIDTNIRLDHSEDDYQGEIPEQVFENAKKKVKSLF